jgi:pSer/pThr/pTyr-binding forkhead associated (FHA) protein
MAAMPASPPPAPVEAAVSEQSQAAPASATPAGPATVTAPAAAAPAAAPAAVPAGTLTFKFPSGMQFVASTDVTNIGRADAAQDWHPELDVIPYGGGVPEMGVSRHHARLVRQDGKYLLMDVGSTNGTYVNGTALEYNKAAELKDGDTVAFGAFSMQVILR